MEKHPDVEYVMLSERKIARRVKELASQMDKLYGGRKPVVVCILKGSVLFFTDLIRHMKTPLTIDFMSVSSYGNGTTSGGGAFYFLGSQRLSFASLKMPR